MTDKHAKKRRMSCEDEEKIPSNVHSMIHSVRVDAYHWDLLAFSRRINIPVVKIVY